MRRAERHPRHEAIRGPVITRSAINSTRADRINAVLAEPEIKKRLVELGGDILIGTPEAFGAMIVAETEKWKKVIEGTAIDKVQ